jgi:hypothetical protein
VESECQEPRTILKRQGRTVFFFFSPTAHEFGLRTSGLLGRCSTTWATPPALFALILEIGPHFMPRPGSSQSSYLCFPAIGGMTGECQAGMTDMHHLRPAISWDGVLKTYCSGMGLSCDPPNLCIPSSEEYRVNHWA